MVCIVYIQGVSHRYGRIFLGLMKKLVPVVATRGAMWKYFKLIEEVIVDAKFNKKKMIYTECRFSLEFFLSKITQPCVPRFCEPKWVSKLPINVEQFFAEFLYHLPNCFLKKIVCAAPSGLNRNYVFFLTDFGF